MNIRRWHYRAQSLLRESNHLFEGALAYASMQDMHIAQDYQKRAIQKFEAALRLQYHVSEAVYRDRPYTGGGFRQMDELARYMPVREKELDALIAALFEEMAHYECDQ